MPHFINFSFVSDSVIMFIWLRKKSSNVEGSVPVCGEQNDFSFHVQFDLRQLDFTHRF